MHPAVELALARMKTHPDDFIGDGKWNQAINDYKKWFTEEETKAINEGLRAMRMEKLQERLFKLMTYVPEPEIDLDMYGRPNGFGLAPIAQSGQPINYSTGATTATWSSQQDEIDELKKAFELFKAQEKTKLDMEHELNNPRL